MHRAQEGASRAEFVGLAEAPRGHSGHARLGGLLLGGARLLRVQFQVRAQPVGVERAGQDVVYGDAVRRDRAGDAGKECGQPRARARRQVEAGERHLHRAGRDVDDAAEFALAHRADHLLDQLDRDDHIGDDAVDHGLPSQVAEILERRAGIVVHQDVGCGAGGKQRLLPVRRSDIGGDRDHLGAGRFGDFGGGGLEPRGVAAVDHHLAAGFGEPEGAGLAEPAARRANDGLAAGNSEIHESLAWSLD